MAWYCGKCGHRNQDSSLECEKCNPTCERCAELEAEVERLTAKLKMLDKDPCYNCNSGCNACFCARSSEARSGG